MFPSFPGFEELPLHMEVECQGQKRPIVARIEQLPTTPPRATLVWSFLDAPDEGEYLLGNSTSDIYTLGNPSHLLRTRTIFRNAGQEREEVVELDAQRVQKLQSHIELALSESRDGWQISRIIELPALPNTPRIALFRTAKFRSFDGGWYNHQNFRKSVSFDTPDLNDQSPFSHAQQCLQTQWHAPNSDVRFAWEWSHWSDAQRVTLSGGIETEAELDEVQQVMMWVITSSPSLWQDQSDIQWSLRWQDGQHRQPRHDDDNSPLTQWQQWLWAHLFSGWRADWIEQHPCVHEFWRFRKIASISRDEPPTFHEQLEARLELRAWLQTRATPAEIEALLPS